MNNLIQAATDYARRGWIPLPLSGKRCYAKSWQLTTLDTWQDNWLTATNSDGVGLLCGNGLFVVDFDNAEYFEAFKRDLPQLAKTYTVSSRTAGHGHLYFAIPDMMELPIVGKISSDNVIQNARYSGLELRYTGAYVAAPPTEGYTITNDADPILLDVDSYTALKTWAKVIASNGDALAATKQVSVAVKQANQVQQKSPARKKQGTTGLNLIDNRYRYELTNRAGRNEALFFTATWARDMGIEEAAVIEALEDSFIASVPPVYHRDQTDDQRNAEFIATVASAYSRPSRNVEDKEQPLGLTDQVREYLCQLSGDVEGQHLGMCILRTWEALIQAEFVPGTSVTRKVARTALKGIVGRDSIYLALDTFAHISEKNFSSKKVSPAPPSQEDATLLNKKQCDEKDTYNCVISRVKKPVKSISNGRPPETYVIPSANQIRVWCGIADAAIHKYSTPINAKDVTSVKLARQKLHTSLIERKTVRASNKWLADRIGVCEQTIRNYNAECGINSTPQYIEIPIIWENVEYIDIPDEKVMGTFLQDDEGTRYPAFRTIARKKLRDKQSISLFKRLPNVLTIGDAPQITQNKPKTAFEVNSHIVAKPDVTPFASRDFHREIRRMQKAVETETAITTAQGKGENPFVKRDWVQAAQASQSVQEIHDDYEHPIYSQDNVKFLQAAQDALDDEINRALKRHKHDAGYKGIEGIRMPSAKAIAKRNANQPQEPSDNPQVEAIQKIINDSATSNEYHISRATVQMLINKHGWKIVKASALEIERRNNVENPAGLLRVMLGTHEWNEKRREKDLFYGKE